MFKHLCFEHALGPLQFPREVEIGHLHPLQLSAQGGNGVHFFILAFFSQNIEQREVVYHTEPKSAMAYVHEVRDDGHTIVQNYAHLHTSTRQYKPR